MNKEEAKKYLKEFVKEIKESDKKEKFGELPSLFFIKETYSLAAPDGFSDDFEYYNRVDPDVVYESIEELQDYYEDGGSPENIGKRYIQLVGSLVNNCFFTRKRCEDHIKDFGYRYRKPTTLSDPAWKNPQIKQLFDALFALYDEEGLKNE